MSRLNHKIFQSEMCMQEYKQPIGLKMPILQHLKLYSSLLNKLFQFQQKIQLLKDLERREKPH